MSYRPHLLTLPLWTGQDGLGWIRTSLDGLGWVRTSLDGLGRVRMGQDGLGWVRTRQDGVGRVRTGQDRLYQLRNQRREEDDQSSGINLENDVKNEIVLERKMSFKSTKQFFEVILLQHKDDFRCFEYRIIKVCIKCYCVSQPRVIVCQPVLVTSDTEL